MEKLKQSEEEILKLGEKIIRELNLEEVDTLGKWMSQYLAELFTKIESKKSKTKKDQLKKECCEVILKIWSNRTNLPESAQPLSNLTQALELLSALEKRDFQFPFWRDNQRISKDNIWGRFVKLTRGNSEKIFELSLYATLSKEILEREKEWVEEHKTSLTKEEIAIIESLDLLLLNRNSPITFTGDISIIDEPSPKKRYKLIIDKMVSLIDEEKVVLEKLRESIFS